MKKILTLITLFLLSSCNRYHVPPVEGAPDWVSPVHLVYLSQSTNGGKLLLADHPGYEKNATAVINGPTNLGVQMARYDVNFTTQERLTEPEAFTPAPGQVYMCHTPDSFSGLMAHIKVYLRQRAEDFTQKVSFLFSENTLQAVLEYDYSIKSLWDWVMEE